VSEGQLSQGTAHWLHPTHGDRSMTRSLCEALIPPVLAALLIIVFPVGSRWFPLVGGILSGFVIVYLIVGLTVLQDSSRRWHIRPPAWNDRKHYVHGGVFVAVFFLVGLGPILAMRYCNVALPNPGSPWRYLAWCVVQDFVFFSLVLRGLIDLIRPYAAVGVTAVLFGFSHFPNYELVFGTILTALGWGYVFLASRWLFFVVLSHWLMGFLLLAR
jgi:Type II CAAX prenyl endopeptidase Rce1-like